MVDSSKTTYMCGILLRCIGFCFFALAIVFNEGLIGLFDPSPPLSRLIIDKIRFTQLCFFGGGIGSFLIVLFIKTIKAIKSLFSKRFSFELILFLLVTLMPLVVIELLLQPFYSRDSITPCVGDARLGWKIRPTDPDIESGGGARINSMGHRGYEIDLLESPGEVRLLYLGDSVAYGHGIPRYEQTFPFLVEDLLRKRRNTDVETVNAAVSGYNTIQEYKYLIDEGVRLSPDAIILTFVLNDVFENAQMRAAGSGQGCGLLLREERTFLDRWFNKSSIIYFVRRFAAFQKFGGDIAQGARKMALNEIKRLSAEPVLKDDKRSWEITLEYLDKINDVCVGKEIPLVLMISPFTFQFEQERDLFYPQKTLNEFAQKRGIIVIDLLDELSSRMREDNNTHLDYFRDEDHASIVGHKVIAEVISDTLIKKGLLENNK